MATLKGTTINGDLTMTGSIKKLAINGGLYWNEYVESSSDGTDAASITVIQNGNGNGGTVLQIKQANDSNDVINLVAGDILANGTHITRSGDNVSSLTNDSGYITNAQDYNFMAHGNEFTFIPSGYSSGNVWLNYRTQGGTGTNANITEYILGNGNGQSLGTIIHTGNIGSQSVSYADSAGAVSWGNVSSKPNSSQWQFTGNYSANNMSDAVYVVSGSGDGASGNHAMYISVNTIGTPFQLEIPDSSIDYIYKRHYSGGWSSWRKINAGYADSAGSASTADALPITGYGNAQLTYYQTADSFQGRSSWASYLICNHGDGSSYYNQIIAMPFWGPPVYTRKEGGNDRGWWSFWTTENLSLSYSSGTLTINF